MNVEQTSKNKKWLPQVPVLSILKSSLKDTVTFSTLSEKKNKKIHWASGNYNVSSLKGEFTATGYTVTFSKKGRFNTLN